MNKRNWIILISENIFPRTAFNPKIIYGQMKAMAFRIRKDLLRLRNPVDNKSVNIIVHSHELLMVGIPKVATTSMIKELVYNQILGEPAEMVTGRLADILDANPILNSYYKVVFVRNPWGRALSFYKSKVCAKNKLFVSPLFIKYKNLRHNMPFSEFINWLCHDVEAGDQWADRHWLSQHRFFTSAEGILVDRVARFESFDSEWGHICSTLGIEKVQLSNLSLKTGEVFDSDGRFYDAELAHLVGIRYKEDVEILGYTSRF